MGPGSSNMGKSSVRLWIWQFQIRCLLRCGNPLTSWRDTSQSSSESEVYLPGESGRIAAVAEISLSELTDSIVEEVAAMGLGTGLATALPFFADKASVTARVLYPLPRGNPLGQD